MIRKKIKINNIKAKIMSEEEHCAFLKGKRIDLTPRTKDHIDVYTKWQNDPKVRTLMSRATR